MMFQLFFVVFVIICSRCFNIFIPMLQLLSLFVCNTFIVFQLFLPIVVVVFRCCCNNMFMVFQLLHPLLREGRARRQVVGAS